MNLQKNKFTLLLCMFLCAYATTSHSEHADRDKPIHMEADRVTVDDPNQLSIFEGKVKLQQGTLLIEADKMMIKQDKNGYSQITATGRLVHLRQKQDRVNEYVEGYGERIEYDSLAEIANIYGQARVKREGDDVRGEHIIYNTKTGVFQVFATNGQTTDEADKGRVTIVIQPKIHKNSAVPSGKALPANAPPTTPPQP